MTTRRTQGRAPERQDYPGSEKLIAAMNDKNNLHTQFGQWLKEKP